jgi:hypothetical protein
MPGLCPLRGKRAELKLVAVKNQGNRHLRLITEQARTVKRLISTWRAITAGTHTGGIRRRGICFPDAGWLAEGIRISQAFSSDA